MSREATYVSLFCLVSCIHTEHSGGPWTQNSRDQSECVRSGTAAGATRPFEQNLQWTWRRGHGAVLSPCSGFCCFLCQRHEPQGHQQNGRPGLLSCLLLYLPWERGTLGGLSMHQEVRQNQGAGFCT